MESKITRTDQDISESLTELRATITRKTSEIGTVAPHFHYEAETLQTTLLRDIYDFEKSVIGEEQLPQQDKLSAESLYEEIEGENERTSILQILKVLNRHRVH